MVSRAERSKRTGELFAQLAETTDPDDRRDLLDQAVLVNRGVAEAVASRYRDRGIGEDDLVQVAYEGLIKAARRFDTGREHDFLTFAVPTIRGELRRHFRDHGWTVRPTRRIQELQWRINQTSEALAQQLGREPTDLELTRELDVQPEDYAEAMQAFGCFTPTSLDQPVGHEGGTTIADILPGDDDVELRPRLRLAPVVRQLSERDRRILFLRFFEDQTQSEIGAELGVTQMQVSRLLSRILVTLREGLGDGDDGDPGGDLDGDLGAGVTASGR